MSCCFCGPVRNCSAYIDKVFENIEKLGSLFTKYEVVVFYDESCDDSLKKLRRHQMKDPRVRLVVNKSRHLSPFRTHRISNARNVCLTYVLNNPIALTILL